MTDTASALQELQSSWKRSEKSRLKGQLGNLQTHQVLWELGGGSERPGSQEESARRAVWRKQPLEAEEPRAGLASWRRQVEHFRRKTT